MYTAVDLFSGCGGMTEGLLQAGFNVIAAVEIDRSAAKAYMANHDKYGVVLFEQDIRTLNTSEIVKQLNEEPLHLLAGCPPCQGFSSVRRKNKKGAVADPRNELIHEYYRFVEELKPLTIMLENVSAIAEYDAFLEVVGKIKRLGYFVEYGIVDISRYGVPQRRKRLVLHGSLLGAVKIAPPSNGLLTVRMAIGNLESVNMTKDPLHKIFPNHTSEVSRRIELTPKNGGSRRDLPEEYTLKCHKKTGIGFNDIYGRLGWDQTSSTITGGCLNPSKGRFLHPEENRCITAREAALLQTFPPDYIFPTDLPRQAIALMIGNALPPEFCRQQAESINKHLDVFHMADIYDKEKRSMIMNAVRNKGTKQELFIRKLFCRLGYGSYRMKTPQLICSPDIVFPGLKKAVFVHGCFWHGHDCPRGALPSDNAEYWKAKITRNKDKDLINCAELIDKGWQYLVIWQCELKIKNTPMLEEKIKLFMASDPLK